MALDRRNVLSKVLLGGVATLSGLACWRSRMSRASQLGTIRAELGQTLADVAAASTYPFDFTDIQDDDLITVSNPVQFSYTGQYGFELPTTQFVGLTTTAVLVTTIEMSPQLDYLGARAVLALASQVEAEAEAAHWQLSLNPAQVISREEAAIYMADPTAPAKSTWHIGQREIGTARLLFKIRRVRRGINGNDDQYLLNLQWSDDKFADRATKIAKQLRIEDGVAIDRWRHVQLSRYAPRVRSLL